MKKFQELRNWVCCSVLALYGQDSHSSNPNPRPFHYCTVLLSASARRAQTQTYSESLRVNLHPSRARSAQMGIVVHILAEFQQMHYICLDVCRFADWSGSCTPSSKYTTM